MNETTNVPNETGIAPETVSKIEAEIAKMEETDRQKLIQKFSREKEDTEAKYKAEVAELNKKYGKTVEEKQDLEKKYAEFATQLDSKINDLSQKFEKTWENFQPPRTGFANTSSNPFKDKTPKEVVKEIGDPRKWKENDAVRELMKSEFFEIANRGR